MQLHFAKLGRRRVIARFDGGRPTSDASGVLLREVDKLLGLLDRLAACFTDHRDADRLGTAELPGHACS